MEGFSKIITDLLTHPCFPFWQVQTKRRKAVSERSRSKPSEEEDTTSNGGGEGIDRMGEADKSTERSSESEEMVVGGGELRSWWSLKDH